MNFRFALLKGRENYICRDRLEEAGRNRDLFRETPYGRALKYLDRFDKAHHTGDLEAATRFLKRYGEDGERARSDVRATEDTCTSDHRDQCRHYRALAEAERAHVIVANHHLALLWPESFPEVHRLVIDEAHALEEAATDVYGLAFAAPAVRARLGRRFRRRRRPGGILARFDRKEWAEFGVDEIADSMEELQQTLGRFELDALRHASIEEKSRRRITDDELTTPIWDEVVNVALESASSMRRLASRVLVLQKHTAAIERFKILSERLQKNALGFIETADFAESIFRPEPVPGTVLWFDRSAARSANLSPRVLYRRSPIDVGPALRSHLYGRFSSVLLTSATLQVCGGFDFLEERLGLKTREEAPTSAESDEIEIPIEEEEDEMTPVPVLPAFEKEAPLLEPERIHPALTVGHPFDYANQVLLCLSTEPRAEDTIELAARVARIAEITRGRMLALFTNTLRMKAAAEHLFVEGVDVVCQYRDGSRHELARRLQTNPHTLLMGTRSFWEGVDVPGENLSVVVMEKIPFTSPGEPVYDARCEDLGSRWFRDYALPMALLTLRQGFGRLIRTEEDRGVVVLLDPGRPSYRGHIKRTLPDCRTIDGDEATILEGIRAFLANKPAETSVP
jgi:ATP-dependent DNA helicase DinG